jgi:hypothetical protein
VTSGNSENGSARRRKALHAAYLALVLGALALAFFCGRDAKGSVVRLDADSHYYYVWLPSVFVDGDLDLTNQYATHGNWYGLGATVSGRPGNVFGVGPAVFAAPLYLFGRAIALVTGATRDGFSTPEIASTLFASVLATVGALVVAGRFLRRRFGTVSAELAAFATLFAGPVVYYAVRQPGYAHAYGALFTAIFIDVWDRSYDVEGPRPVSCWLVLGAAFGAVVLARPQLATWGILFVAAILDDAQRAVRSTERRRLALAVVGAVAVALLVFAPQLVAWRAVYGSMFVLPQGVGFMRWTEAAWSEVLFSARNGLFAWAPLYALAGVGLVWSARSRVGGLLLAGVVLQVFVNGAVWDWWAGGSFGGRRFCSCYLAFAFGAATLLDRISVSRAGSVIGPAVALFCSSANSELAFTYGQPDVRIEGGRSPSSVMRERQRSFLGRGHGALSDAVLAVPRAVFALRYGTTFGGYDAVVGVHRLDELYPGLDVVVPQDDVVLRVDGVSAPFAVGFGEDATILSDRATLLIPLNEHRKALTVEVELDAVVPETFALEWNGEKLQGHGDGRRFAVVALPLRRGVNVLALVGGRSARVRQVRLTAVSH